jgi:hypothetical protein
MTVSTGKAEHDRRKRQVKWDRLSKTGYTFIYQNRIGRTGQAEQKNWTRRKGQVEQDIPNNTVKCSYFVIPILADFSLSLKNAVSVTPTIFLFI